MKKILTLLTAIAFSGTLLIAGSSGNSSKQVKSTTGDSAKIQDLVIIHLDTEMDRLLMYDSNDPSPVEDLTTIVYPGTTVIWMIKEGSDIEEILAIIPLNKGKIMKKAAEHIPDSKRFMHKVPLNAPVNVTEEYIIVYKDADNKVHLKDPYLKIPDL